MKWSLLFLIALLCYSCAGKKMVVENADTLITYQINKRLSLYSAQKEELSKEVDKFLNESKPKAQDILPIIDDLNLKDPSKLDANYSKVEGFYIVLARDFSTMLSKYLAKLDIKQRKDFFETLDDENREMLKKEKEERIDDIEDRFKTFLGSINSKQKQLVREYAAYFHDRAKARLDRRVKLHERLKEIYNQDVSEASSRIQIQDAMVEYQDDARAGNKNLEILKKIIPTLTEPQRQYFRKEAQEVKDILRYFNTVVY